jgi:hypothetical protein
MAQENKIGKNIKRKNKGLWKDWPSKLADVSCNKTKVRAEIGFFEKNSQSIESEH